MFCTAIMACGAFLFHPGDQLPIYMWSQFPLTLTESHCRAETTFLSDGIAIKKAGKWTLYVLGPGTALSLGGSMTKCKIYFDIAIIFFPELNSLAFRFQQ